VAGGFNFYTRFSRNFLSRKIYSWLAVDPAVNNSVAAKWPVFTCSGFIVTVGGFLRHLVAASSSQLRPLVAQAG